LEVANCQTTILHVDHTVVILIFYNVYFQGWAEKLHFLGIRVHNNLHQNKLNMKITENNAVSLLVGLQNSTCSALFTEDRCKFGQNKTSHAPRTFFVNIFQKVPKMNKVIFSEWGICSSSLMAATRARFWEGCFVLRGGGSFWRPGLLSSIGGGRFFLPIDALKVKIHQNTGQTRTKRTLRVCWRHVSLFTLAGHSCVVKGEGEMKIAARPIKSSAMNFSPCWLDDRGNASAAPVLSSTGAIATCIHQYLSIEHRFKWIHKVVFFKFIILSITCPLYLCNHVSGIDWW
jgi:hypothetical protein